VYSDKGWYFYTPDVFEWYVGYPQNDPESYFLAFDDGTNKIVGYFSINTFHMAINGQKSYLFGYPTMITVDVDHQSQGIGKALGTYVKPFYERKGYIGGFQTFEDGSRGYMTVPPDQREGMLEMWHHDYGYIRPLNMKRIGAYLSLKWYEWIATRLLEGVAPVNNPHIRDFQDGDESQIKLLWNSLADKINFTRIWSDEEVSWYLHQPLVHAKVYEDGDQILGIVCASVVPFMIQGYHDIIGIIENYFYENLPPRTQNELVRKLLWDLKRQNVPVVLDIAVGYQEHNPLKNNRFLGYKRGNYLTIEVFSQQELFVPEEVKKWTTYFELR
jgi:GNAT superfamily N-acetyltransferase